MSGRVSGHDVSGLYICTKVSGHAGCANLRILSSGYLFNGDDLVPIAIFKPRYNVAE
jgi:hypothetical protein